MGGSATSGFRLSGFRLSGFRLLALAALACHLQREPRLRPIPGTVP